MKPHKQNDKFEIKNENESADFVKMTSEERRAMTKAAWLLGLKAALIGAGLLLAMFMLMQALVSLWSL